MRIGSLFSGYGGLDLAALQLFPQSSVAWHCEWDDAPAMILNHHWPSVPNLRDVTEVDWATIEPVDILTGGYPCQPFSAAGQRKGTDDERHLWPYVRDAMATLRPRYGLFENVLGHLTLGFDEVITDLSEIGYSVRWTVLRASDIGAPHHRARIFILAEDRYARPIHSGPDRRGGVHSTDGVEAWGSSGLGRGSDVSEGTSDSSEASFDIWREHAGAQAGQQDSDTSGDLVMADGGDGGHRLPEEDQALSHLKARAGGAGHLVSRDGIEDAARTRQGASVVGGDEGAWAARSGANVGTQQEGAGAENDSGQAPLGDIRRDAMGDAAVDAGRVAGRVHGSVSETWGDDRRTDLRVGPADAPHHRERIFILVSAPNADGSAFREHAGESPSEEAGAQGGDRSGDLGGERSDQDRRNAPDPNSGEYDRNERTQGRSAVGREAAPGNRAGFSADAEGQRLSGQQQSERVQAQGSSAHGSVGLLPGIDWGDYGPAVRRWERLTRLAPAPTELNSNHKPRLNAAFAEWMMGLAAGHVTAVPGISRAHQLKAIGNGVCPQQAVAAYSSLLELGVAA